MLLFWFHNFRWTWWKAKLEIQDAQRQPIMVINGPCCPCSCGSDVEFPVSFLGSEILLIVILTWSPFKSKIYFIFISGGLKSLQKQIFQIWNLFQTCKPSKGLKINNETNFIAIRSFQAITMFIFYEWQGRVTRYTKGQIL